MISRTAFQELKGYLPDITDRDLLIVYRIVLEELEEREVWGKKLKRKD